MKRLLLIIIIILLGFPCWAQDDEFRVPDSLIILLEENPEPDQKRAEALITILQYLSIERHYFESRPYVEELAVLADELKDPYIKAASDLSTGCLIIETGNDIKQAFKSINNAFIITSQLPKNEKSLSLMVKIYNSMGVCHSLLGMEADAYECYIKGIEINDKIHDKHNDYVLKMNMLNTFFKMQKYDESISFVKEMLADENNDYDRYIPYCFMASNYKAKEIFDTALMYYDTASHYAKSERDKSLCITNIGLTNLSMGNVEKAFENFSASLTDYSEFNTTETKIINMIYLGVIYGMRSELDSALLLLDKGIEMARKNRLAELEIEGLAGKGNLLHNAGKEDEYYENMTRYVWLTDSVHQNNDAMRLETLWLQQEFKQAETQWEYEKQLSDLNHRKSRILLLLAVFALVLVVAVMLLLLNRKKMILESKDIELKNKELKEKSLADELNLRNRELTARTLVQVQRQELLDEMIGKLNAILEDKKKLSTNLCDVIKTFEQYKSASNPDDFDHYFTQINPDFYEHLRTDFPNLTPNELRLCAYLKMNMNTKDIAAICNITPESARVARTRLRKSLGLADSSIDLATFLSKY